MNTYGVYRIVQVVEYAFIEAHSPAAAKQQAIDNPQEHVWNHSSTNDPEVTDVVLHCD